MHDSGGGFGVCGCFFNQLRSVFRFSCLLTWGSLAYYLLCFFPVPDAIRYTLKGWLGVGREVNREASFVVVGSFCPRFCRCISILLMGVPFRFHLLFSLCFLYRLGSLVVNVQLLWRKYFYFIFRSRGGLGWISVGAAGWFRYRILDGYGYPVFFFWFFFLHICFNLVACVVWLV